MGHYFGTDGFRGEANVDLTGLHAYKVGRFLGYYYGREERRAKIVIGKDTRRSSYMLEYALAAGLAASGADAYLLHVTTTPSVAYVARTEGFDCGIMISASHNPYFDNGIKLISGSGQKMDPAVEAKVEEYLDGPEDAIPMARKDRVGRSVDFIMGRNRYMGYLMSLATHSYKGLRIGLDCANGSSWFLGKALFDALGAKTFVIHNEPDGTNINLDCGSTHIESLRQFVYQNKLDVGFAYDGDADRCMAVDENGQVVDGDKILYLCGCYMKEKGELDQNTVVTTVMSNLGLYKAFDRMGISYVKTAVGDRNVYDAMSEHHYSLGGEQSGHIIFSKHATTGDGILTSIKILEVMLEQKKSLSGLCRDLEIFPQELLNVRVRDKDAAISDPEVQCAVERAADALGEDGRILVRKSGTEPLIRIMTEASSSDECRRINREIAAILKKNGHLSEA